MAQNKSKTPPTKDDKLKNKRTTTRRARRTTIDTVTMADTMETVDEDEEDVVVEEKKKLSKDVAKKPTKAAGTKNKRRGKSKSPSECTVSVGDEATSDGYIKFLNWALNIHQNGGFQKYFDDINKYAPPPETNPSNAMKDSSNVTKNRNQDLLCLDATRVKLPLEDEYTSDYIHANYVDLYNKRKCIITQYPLANTIEDFWRMVFATNADVIMAVCNVDLDKELGDVTNNNNANDAKSTKTSKSTMTLEAKSARGESMRMEIKPCTHLAYWPLLEGQYTYYGKLFVNTRKVEKGLNSHHPTVYTIEVLPAGCADSKIVKLHNFWSWPKDKHIPTSAGMHRLIRTVDPNNYDGDGTAIVHCDFGVDRSAALVFSIQLIRLIQQKNNMDFGQWFKNLRNMRAGALQTWLHFIGVIHCMNKYIDAQKKIMKPEVGIKTKELDAILKPIVEPFKNKIK